MCVCVCEATCDWMFDLLCMSSFIGCIYLWDTDECVWGGEIAFTQLRWESKKSAWASLTWRFSIRAIFFITTRAKLLVWLHREKPNTNTARTTFCRFWITEARITTILLFLPWSIREFFSKDQEHFDLRSCSRWRCEIITISCILSAYSCWFCSQLLVWSQIISWLLPNSRLSHKIP